MTDRHMRILRVVARQRQRKLANHDAADTIADAESTARRRKDSSADEGARGRSRSTTTLAVERVIDTPTGRPHVAGTDGLQIEHCSR